MMSVVGTTMMNMCQRTVYRENREEETSAPCLLPPCCTVRRTCQHDQTEVLSEFRE
jgi:hypothetical protein